MAGPQISSTEAVKPSEPSTSRRLTSGVWYSVAFSVVPFVLLLVCLFLSSKRWFLDHDDYPALRITLGYSLRANNVNCDILLYGDSTPLTGLDPAIFQAKTGLKTCNLAEFRPVHWIVTSYYPIDQYLLHNSKPKYILTDWAAFEFHPETQTFAHYQPEGYVYAMLFDRGPWLWKGFLTHPLWTVNFSIWVGNRIINDALSRADPQQHARQWAVETVSRDSRAGAWHDPAPPATRCGVPRPLHPISRDQTQTAIAEFKAHYERLGIRVIFDVSPIADCVPNREELIGYTTGFGEDNKLAFLPVRFFNTQDVHFTTEGSRFISNEQADQLIAIMAKDKVREAVTAKTSGEVQSR